MPRAAWVVNLDAEDELARPSTATPPRSLGLRVAAALPALVAQDGTRVRASASAPSFRRAESLEACREQAQLHLRAVLAEDDDEADLRARKAREAKAREHAERVEAAIAAVKQLSLIHISEPTRPY